MKTKIVGVIAVIYGFALMLEQPQGALGSDYRLGQMLGKIAGLVLFVAGLIALYKAFKRKKNI